MLTTRARHNERILGSFARVCTGSSNGVVSVLQACLACTRLPLGRRAELRNSALIVARPAYRIYAHPVLPGAAKADGSFPDRWRSTKVPSGLTTGNLGIQPY